MLEAGDIGLNLQVIAAIAQLSQACRVGIHGIGIARDCDVCARHSKRLGPITVEQKSTTCLSGTQRKQYGRRSQPYPAFSQLKIAHCRISPHSTISC